MRDFTLKIGRRTDRETIAVAHFSSGIEARLVWQVLNRVSEAHGIDPKSYVVVAECEQHGTDLLLCLAAGTDHDAQLDASITAVEQELSVRVRCREMSPREYEPHALLARMAKAQDN